MNHNLEIKDGVLQFGGCDTLELAKQYGTPLYVMDENRIRQACRRYLSALEQQQVIGRVLFASKAFLSVALCKILEQEGMGLDVVSFGELYTAVMADFPRRMIYMHGNNKSAAEIDFAVRENIGSIVIDSFEEIARVGAAAQLHGKLVPVSLRIKPGVEAHTHQYIQTAQEDSKFGVGLADGGAMAAVKAILAHQHLEFKGLHCHIGSQIFETEPYIKVVDIFVQFLLQVKKETGHLVNEVNLGGGFGIAYTQQDAPLQPEEYFLACIQELRRQSDRGNIILPEIVIEPGRSIVGNSGITLYTVGAIKDIPGVRKYVSVDGGMSDNPRYALYQAKYDAVIANRADQPHSDTVTIAGRCCESGDIVTQDAALQPAQAGDTLAVLSTGAYNYSMAGNYNKLPIPAVVLVKDGKSDVMVRRQTIEELVAREEMPEWLN